MRKNPKPLWQAAPTIFSTFRSTSGEVNRLSTCVDGIKTHTEYQEYRRRYVTKREPPSRMGVDTVIIGLPAGQYSAGKFQCVFSVTAAILGTTQEDQRADLINQPSVVRLHDTHQVLDSRIAVFAS